MFNATNYLAIWGAKNPALVKQQTFNRPEQNEKFLATMANVRIKLRSGFVPVAEVLESVGFRKVNRYKYA